MSTSVFQPLIDARPADGGAPARRAVVRWAWRLFRREWRQHLLILALIIAAVTATIVASAVATNAPPPSNAGFGTASYMATIAGTDLHPGAQIAYVDHLFGRIDVIENQALRVPGSTSTYQLRVRTRRDPTAARCSRSSRVTTHRRRTRWPRRPVSPWTST